MVSFSSDTDVVVFAELETAESEPEVLETEVLFHLDK